MKRMPRRLPLEKHYAKQQALVSLDEKEKEKQLVPRLRGSEAKMEKNTK